MARKSVEYLVYMDDILLVSRFIASTTDYIIHSCSTSSHKCVLLYKSQMCILHRLQICILLLFVKFADVKKFSYLCSVFHRCEN